jgi:hypothetical protein
MDAPGVGLSVLCERWNIPLCRRRIGQRTSEHGTWRFPSESLMMVGSPARKSAGDDEEQSFAIIWYKSDGSVVVIQYWVLQQSNSAYQVEMTVHMQFKANQEMKCQCHHS